MNEPIAHDPLRRRALGALIASASAMALAPVALAKELPTNADDPREVLDLWPDGPPGGSGVRVAEEIVERESPANLRDRIIRHVRRPRLSVFRAHGPAKGCFLILPGGGYKHVVIDKEGFETARWLASAGFAAFVLFYRLPGDGWEAGPDAPLQDVQRAMRLIRSRAREWQFDPARIGILGFSAGGHLAARAATRHALRTYEPVDAVDDASTRPDVAALMYPVITLEGAAAHAGSREFLLGRAPDATRLREFSAQSWVASDTPPTFLLHAGDDASVPVENSLLMHAALRAAGVLTELHVFSEGGHGFGLRGVSGRPVEIWPDLLTGWAERRFGASRRL